MIETNVNLTIPQLQQLVTQLPINDRWGLVKILIESLQPNLQNVRSSVEQPIADEDHPLAKFCGSIQDETFIRHPQGEQSEREPLI
ncbi:MAG: hypothetical protein LH474_02825 [Chamaesiphon sp.]|nr:hypothetical protein [Chamaesiphon sp.]